MSTTEGSILLRPISRTVAEAILEQLELFGVKRIYGVIGDAIFGLMDAIAKNGEIQFIAVKHESVAAMMASAEAKCTGGLGVCAAQMGPGLANLINGLGDAFLDGFPVLAISGQAPLKKIGTSYKQYINQQELVQAVTGDSQLVVHPDAVIGSLTKAIYTSITMDTVSHLSIPADVFTVKTLVPTNKPTSITDGEFCTEQLEKGLQIMYSAKNPMILIGNKVGPLSVEIQQLAERWGGGIATAYGAVGILPDSCPYGLGGLGEGGNPFLTHLFKQADVVLAIGTSWWPEGHTPVRARVIQVQNRQTNLGNGMPVDCGIVGNMSDIILQLISRFEPHDRNQEWVGQINQCKQTWAAQNEEEGNKSSFPLQSSRVIRAIERCTTPDTVIALDEGDFTLWFMRNFRAQCEHVLLSSNWRTMGFGLPSALAAKLCMPNKHVICVTGDGGLAMVLADLLTAVRYRLKITVIILNNGMLQMEYNKMVKKGLTPEGVELTNPDFVMLAKACGWEAFRIQSGDELEQLLITAQMSENPVILDVPTAQVSYPNYQIS
ncbi:thiamine pyrophosphate-binding protein [Neobacillus sp. GCM10023253]|uniref:thiamine pyrophosphate-binding protein n=1 Tax=Neobacillus sp. GCM10023253 TaxID=3252644 RepID=UPI003622E0FD